jgi:TP901 family phage tail tape measure protein
MADIPVSVILSLQDQLTQRLNGVVKKTLGEMNKLSTSGVLSRGEQLQKQAENYASVMRAVAIPFTASVGAQAASLKLFSDHEYDIKYISTLIDDTNYKYDQYSRNVRKIAIDTGKGIHDVSRAFYQSLSSGIKPVELNDFVGGASKAAVAGGVGLETAITPILSIMNAYGIKAKDVTKVSDQLFRVVEDGVIEFNQLGGAVSNFASIGSLGKFDLVEQLAAVAALTKGGLSPDEAGTSIARMLDSIITASDEQKELAQSFGIEFSYEAAQKKGLLKFLREVKEATGGNVVALQKLFPETRALRAVGLLAGTMGDAFVEAAEKITNSAGATERAFDKMSSASKVKFDKMKTSIQSIAIDIGASVYDSIEVPLENLQKYLAKAAEDPATGKKLSTGLKATAGVSGSILGIMALGYGKTLAAQIGLAAKAGWTGTALAGKSGLIAKGVHTGSQMIHGAGAGLGKAGAVLGTGGSLAAGAVVGAGLITKGMDSQMEANQRKRRDRLEGLQGMSMEEFMKLQSKHTKGQATYDESKKYLSITDGMEGRLGEIYREAMNEPTSLLREQGLRTWEEAKRSREELLQKAIAQEKLYEKSYQEVLNVSSWIREKSFLGDYSWINAIYMGMQKIIGASNFREAENAKQRRRDAMDPLSLAHQDMMMESLKMPAGQLPDSISDKSSDISKKYDDMFNQFGKHSGRNSDVIIKNISVEINDTSMGNSSRSSSRSRANVRVEMENTQTSAERMLDVDVIRRGGVFPE